MSDVKETQNGNAALAAQLLFAAFLFVADANDGLNARELRKFHDLVDDPSWCKVLVLQEGLHRLRTDFSGLWKDYQKKALKRDSQNLTEKLDGVMRGDSGLARPEISGAIELFIDRILDNPSPILQRLGLSTTTPAKQQARQTLAALLSAFNSEDTRENLQARASQDKESEVAPTTEFAGADLSIWPAAGLVFSPEHAWRRGRTPVRCIAVIPETHDVRTFVFQAAVPVLFNFKPGQFVTLELPIGGKTVRRSYTISSSPSRPHGLSITVKRVAGGLVSNWLHDNMVVDFEFNLSGPNGDFSCFDAPAEKLLLIGGGSGVTPVMSMLRWLVDTQSPANIAFINNVRSPADIVFERELAYLASRFGPKLKLGIVPSTVNPGQTWNGPVSRFNEELLRALVPDYAERTVFVCGPAGYMAAIRSLLEQLGHPMHAYHEESFGSAPVAPQGASVPPARAKTAVVAPPVAAQPAATPGDAPAVVASGKLSIVFSRSGKTLQAGTEDCILDLAEANGIKMESSCRAGNCGTCKIKKTEGGVEMDDQRALSESDLLDGYVLACVARGLGTRLVLDA